MEIRCQDHLITHLGIDGIYRHPFYSVGQIARAIRKSWSDYDADILNNSWGSQVAHDRIIRNLVKAAEKGRNGKGCVVVASSGNEGSTTHVSTIAEPPAAPMVSGVASLMLSVNPELTSAQVKEIVESTAQKLDNNYSFTTTSAHPNGSWNAEVGYGLVDAYKAVVNAFEYGYDMKILGPDVLADCDNRVYTCDILQSELFTYDWICSANFAIVSEDGATAHVMPLAVGDGTVTVNVKHQGETMFTLYKNVTVSSLSVDASPIAAADFSITSNTTWSTSTYLPVEVTVENGSTLTITGTVQCAPEARIVVRPGARLIVDGGTLTNACDNDLWKGIFVEGNASQHQTSTHQGVVELRNGATIENAIAVNGSSHATITRCDFDLTYTPVPSMRMNTGLYLNACTGYKVEQNDFHKSYNAVLGNNTVGVRVNNSGTDDNVIYRNTFTNMGYAVYAQGTNGRNRPGTGLEVKCNEFSGNNYDVYVASGATIRPTQGSSLVSAGNTFDDTQISCLYAVDNNNYQYLYSSGQEPLSHHNFATYVSANANTCASTLCSDGPITPNPVQMGGSAVMAMNGNVGNAYATSHEAVRQLMNDTVVSLPAIKGWHSATPGLASQYAVAETECQMGNDNAQILQTIEDSGLSTSEQRAEYENYAAFNALKYQTDGWTNATPQQIEQLQAIADNHTGRSSVMAQSVLCFYFDLCGEDDIPEVREDGKSARLDLQSEWVYWTKPQNTTYYNYAPGYLDWVYPTHKHVIKDTILDKDLFYHSGGRSDVYCYITDFEMQGWGNGSHPHHGQYYPVWITADRNKVFIVNYNVFGTAYNQTTGTYFEYSQCEAILLYDFSLEAGDRYEIQSFLKPAPDRKILVTIDSVGNELIDGKTLRVQFAHDSMLCEGWPCTLGKDTMAPYRIIERIGSEYYFVPQNIMPPLGTAEYYVPDLSVGLCSYSDEEMYYQANEDMSCEFPRPVSIEEHAPSDCTIGPNPTNDKVTVSVQEGMIEGIQVYDVVGRLMLSMKPQHTNDIEVDLSHFPEGVYILKVTKDNNQIISQKVTKIR